MTEPEVTVNVEVEAPPAEAEPLAEAPAVESVVALVEHVEEDTPKWIDNAVEHERIWNAIHRLENRENVPVVDIAPEPVIEAVVEEAVEEAIEEAMEDEEGSGEGEVEIDIPPVQEEVVPEAKGSPFNIFEDLHNE